MQHPRASDGPACGTVDPARADVYYRWVAECYTGFSSTNQTSGGRARPRYCNNATCFVMNSGRTKSRRLEAPLEAQIGLV
eukprot:5081887-Prymnesium_polylepis.2